MEENSDSVFDKLAIVFICLQEEGSLFSGGRKTYFFYIRSWTLRDVLAIVVCFHGWMDYIVYLVLFYFFYIIPIIFT